MANLIGQRLGQYEIVALLGEGGMAAVYRAHQTSMKRDVAIKVIKTGLLQMGEFVKRFEREAQTVAGLNHPHILKVFDYGQHGDMVYLVMELQVGGSLADLIRGGPLSPDLASRALEQIAAALDYAHERGIIHRDLKPQNVLLDEKRNAILTDFGIAKILNDTAALTQSGVAMGTPAYMSPEQWQGRPLDARTDVYALGIMLFEMLTGKQPFSAETPPTLMYMHLTEQPPLLSGFRPDLPASVQQVLSKALAKDPEQRFGSAGEMAAAFKQALVSKETARVQPTRPAQPDVKPVQPGQQDMPTLAERPTPADMTVTGKPPEEPKKRAVWPFLAALVVVIAIGVVLVMLSSGGLGGGPTPGAASATSTAAVVVVPTTAVPTAGTPAAFQTRAAATSTMAAHTTGTFNAMRRQTSDALAAATNTALAAASFTKTSTKTSTSTPPPPPTSAPITLPISGVSTILRDDFDGNRLADAWATFGTGPVVKDGMLILTGRDRWDDGVLRFPIRENEGALLLFQYETAGVSSISLDSGEYSKDNFRQLRIQANPESATIVSASGVQGSTTTSYGKTAEMRPGTWYYLLFRVGENGSFYVQLWERDSPSIYVLNAGVTPPGEDWAKRDWAFVIHPYHGEFKADAYWEIHFPAGYRLPNEVAVIPPLLGTATYAAAVATQTPGAGRPAPFKVAFVPPVADPFYAMVQKGIEQAASDFGAEVIMQVPEQVDPAMQADAITALRDKNINALIVAPVDPRQIVATLEAAHQQGTQVISVDVPVGDARYDTDPLSFMLSHVGSDPLEGGRLACEMLAQSIDRKGKVYIQNGSPDFPTFAAREKGCRDVLAKYPDISLVGVDYNEFSPDKAEVQLKAVLQREGGLAGIFSTTSFGVAGISKAVVNAGLQGKVKIAAIDAHPEVIEAIRAGVVTFTFAQKPYDIGYLAAAYALARLNGAFSVPKLTLTGFVPINSENVNDPAVSRFFYTGDIGKPLPPLSNYTVGFVPGVEHAYYRAIENGVNNAARLLGFKVITRVPQQWDPAVQAPIIQAVVGENINALIAVPTDREMVPVFEAVGKRGIPVIHVDTFIGDGNYADGPVKFPLSYIGTDNVVGGRLACEVLAESIGKKGKVYIQDMIPGPDLSPRAQGCKEALAHYPDIELVGVDFNDGDTGKSEEQTTAVLEREKDLAGIFVINLSAVEGTGRAVEKAGKKGTVRLVAFDATAGNIESLKAGVLSVVIGQRPHDMGFLAVICAAANARGVDSFPKRVATDFVIINADNVNDPGLAGLIY